jgi:hypothetical protein
MRKKGGLLDSGLHEDHADFGGGLEDEFAVARGVGGIVEGDELVGDGACAVAEIGDAGAEGLRRESGAPGASRLAEDLTEGFEDPGGFSGMRPMASPLTRRALSRTAGSMTRYSWGVIPTSRESSK